MSFTRSIFAFQEAWSCCVAFKINTKVILSKARAISTAELHCHEKAQLQCASACPAWPGDPARKSLLMLGRRATVNEHRINRQQTSRQSSEPRGRTHLNEAPLAGRYLCGLYRHILVIDSAVKKDGRFCRNISLWCVCKVEEDSHW